jgi:predicted nuclease of predicted toxin-antitoxin system
MPLSIALAAWLRDQGHDAVHAIERGLFRATDSEIVEHAVREARTVVTADLDYPRLLATTGKNAPGLILFREGAWSESEARKRIADVLDSLSEAEIAQSIIVIEPGRVRRRRLPLQF